MALQAACKPIQALARCQACTVPRCGAPASRALAGLAAAPRSVAAPSLPARATRRSTTVPRAAAAAPAAEAVFEATGVPLVDYLGKLTVDEAVKQSIYLVAAAAVGVAVGAIVLKVVGSRAGSDTDADGSFNPLGAALASVVAPTRALLPFYGIAFSATVASSLAQVTAVKMKAQFNTLCFDKGPEVLSVLKHVTQLVQDTSELVVIVGAAWAACAFKDRVIGWTTNLLGGNKGNSNLAVALMRPLSSVLSALIYIVAFTTALSAYGINVAPLVASVGGLGVAIGLATQSVAQNVVGALSLYSGAQFVVGDRVQLMAAGAPVVEGTVEAIEPMCTTIRDNDGHPVYLSNSEVTACSVRNYSRKR